MNKYIESYINKEVLYREALTRGFSERENIKKSIEEYTKKVLIKSLTEEILKREISDKEIEQYYGANREKYKTALVTRVSVTPRDKENDNPRDKNNLYSVKIRESFEINKEKYNKILADVVFNMNIGEVSEPVKLHNSYVIFKILNGPGYIPFKNVKNNIWRF
jgi:predicted site-specific integrase-resolvase